MTEWFLPLHSRIILPRQSARATSSFVETFAQPFHLRISVVRRRIILRTFIVRFISRRSETLLSPGLADLIAGVFLELGDPVCEVVVRDLLLCRGRDPLLPTDRGGLFVLVSLYPLRYELLT
jgi:hypothetical protein